MAEKLNVSKKEWQSSANKRRTRGLAGNELIQIFEIYDDIPIAAHLATLMRSRGKIVSFKEDGITPVYKDKYHLKDEEMLKDIETYRAELDSRVTEEA